METRPWGFYKVLSESPTYKIKHIYVNPNSRLSYQKHSKRAEHWFILSGLAKVTIEGTIFDVGAGDTVDIDMNQLHRIESLDGTVEFIEVQTGTYFGEDDIVRVEDDYDRA